jgi:hypothetical protein
LNQQRGRTRIVGEIVNEILGRLSALNGAAGGPVLGQQCGPENEAAESAANGDDGESEFHLAPPPEEPCSPRMTDAIDLLDQDAEALAIAVDEAELGRRLWRLFDAPLACRGDQTSFRESVHSAHFPQSKASAPKASAAMRENTAIMLRARG